MAEYDNETLTKLCAAQTAVNNVQWDLRPFGKEFMGRVWVDREDLRPHKQTWYFFHLFIRHRAEEPVRHALHHVLSVTQHCPSVERAGALLAKISRVLDRKFSKEHDITLGFKSPLEYMSVWKHHRTGHRVYTTSVSFGSVRLVEVGNNMSITFQREPVFVTDYRLEGVERV